MKSNDVSRDNANMTALCVAVRALIVGGEFGRSEAMIRQAMAEYPHAPEPHNLMGIQLENEEDHIAAMKHFRAAWALDPTYTPARFNIYQYADVLGGSRRDAYVQDDCPQEQGKPLYETEYNSSGIGRLVIKKDNTVRCFQQQERETKHG